MKKTTKYTFIIFLLVISTSNNLYSQDIKNSLSIGLHKTFWTNGDTPGFLLKTDYQHPINRKYGLQAGLGFSRASDLKGIVNREYGELPGYFYVREHVVIEAGVYRSFYLNDIENSYFNLFISGFYLSINEIANAAAAINRETDELLIVNNYYNLYKYGVGVVVDYKFDFYRNTKIGPNVGLRWLFDQGNMIWNFGMKLLINLD